MAFVLALLLQTAACCGDSGGSKVLYCPYEGATADALPAPLGKRADEESDSTFDGVRAVARPEVGLERKRPVPPPVPPPLPSTWLVRLAS